MVTLVIVIAVLKRNPLSKSNMVADSSMHCSLVCLMLDVRLESKSFLHPAVEEAYFTVLPQENTRSKQQVPPS